MQRETERCQSAECCQKTIPISMEMDLITISVMPTRGTTPHGIIVSPHHMKVEELNGNSNNSAIYISLSNLNDW